MKKTAEKASPAVKKTAPKTEKRHFSFQNLGSGILLLVIGGAMTTFAAFLLWQHVFRATDLEKIIPEHGLGLFVNLETLDGFTALQGANEEWNERFRALRNIAFGIDADAAWRGERGGVALYDLSGGVEIGNLDMVTFLEVRDAQAARADLTARGPRQTESVDGTEIFEFQSPQERYCMLFSGYLACAPEQFLLQSILEDEGEKLAENADFQAVAAELPRAHALRFFLRAEALAAALRPEARYQALLPILEQLQDIGGTVTEDTAAKKLGFSMAFWSNDLGAEKDLSNERIEFVSGIPELLSWVPPEATGLIWGNDLAEDLFAAIGTFEKIDPAFALMLQAQLRTWAAELFGTEISWEADLLPLLEKEFVVGSLPEGFFALVKTGDAEFATAKAEKLKKGLSALVARFSPKIVSHTLEDGTTIREVFPNEDDVTTAESTQSGAKVFTITAGESGRKVQFAQKDDLLFVSSGVGALEMNPEEEATPLLADFPIEFAGASEEVFASTASFLKNFWPQVPTEKWPEFERIAGKIVTTPRFLRIQGEVEVE